MPEGGRNRALGHGSESRRGAGTSHLHVTVDDNNRIAYAEQLPDKRKGWPVPSWSGRSRSTMVSGSS